MLTPEQRVMRARIAASTRWAKESDRRAATQAARLAALERFAREVDPNNELDPAERARRAGHAQRAHMMRLALQSSKARARGGEAA